MRLQKGAAPPSYGTVIVTQLYYPVTWLQSQAFWRALVDLPGPMTAHYRTCWAIVSAIPRKLAKLVGPYSSRFLTASA